MSDTVTVVEEVIHSFETSAPAGPAGPSGEIVPSSVVINRTDGEISSLDFASGKTVTINRAGGEIVSVYDGTYLKTIVRENDEITEIVVV